MGFTLKRFSFQSAKHTIFFSLSMFQNKNACHFTLNSIMFFAFSHLFHLHFSHLIQPLLTVGVTLGIYEIESGKLKVASCKWQVESGKLQVESGKLKVAS